MIYIYILSFSASFGLRNDCCVARYQEKVRSAYIGYRRGCCFDGFQEESVRSVDLMGSL